MPATQAQRPIAIETPLGEDTLLLRSFSVREQIGAPFVIEADLLSETDFAVKFDDIVGHGVTIRLQLGDGSTRYFSGCVSRFTQLANHGSYARYHATIVPWLWLLTRASDCRIFQEKSVPDIIKEVFDAHGFADYENTISGSHDPRTYVVQYRETDFNFVSRLMEEEGIYYWFKHENGKHTLVLADAASSSEPFPGYETIPFNEITRAGYEQETIFDWVVEKLLQPVKYAVTDYEPTTPTTSLLATTDKSRAHGQARFEIYDYATAHTTVDGGEKIAKIRLEELGAQHEVGRGQARARGIAAGSTFEMKGHGRSDQDRKYLVTSVAIDVDGGEFESGKNEGEFFTCQFTAIPADQPYRQPRNTPKPVIRGPQTAVVVGPKGEEIYTDKYGRVKVHFFWDRLQSPDEKASCWIRVAQHWAGKQYGAAYHPRVGHEVIVEFLEGDPDRPIITGRVYNGVNMPPYALPGMQTISTLKSNTSKGGGGFNEIRFEDKKGDEQIFIHGEKNVDIRVKNDTFEWIGHDRHLLVKNDQVEKVENDRHENIKRDHVEEIGRDHHLKIKGKEAIEVTGSHSFKVKDDVIEEFAKNQSTQITEDLYIKAKNIVIEASTNITINVGNSYIAIEQSGIKIATDGDIAIEAKKNITQKATMDWKAEATMNGALKGTVGLKLEGTAQAELKGALTTVKADGILTVQGGLVKIN